MTKINREEYKLLKGLDDYWKWKWVARDSAGLDNEKLFLYSEKPYKDYNTKVWSTDDNRAFLIFEQPFQFIQWEDEEPHNIAELIEEYESEETEVKKNKEWAQKEVDRYLSYEGVEAARNALAFAKGVINQLDEPEVLSQEDNINIVLDDLKEHIKEQQSLSQNVGMAHTPAGNDTHYRQYDYVLECINEYEPSEDLQSPLVPKQEKVKIPYFIEEHIQTSLNYSEESTVVGKIENYMLPRIDETETDSRVLKFFNTKDNIDLVALAMITENYEVEEEPLYRARLKVITDEFIASYLRTQSSGAEDRLKALEIGSKYIHEDYRHLSEFTEDELKKLDIWDSEQWEVEEVEEDGKN